MGFPQLLSRAILNAKGFTEKETSQTGKRLKRLGMAQVETTIDSIRVAAVSPERTILLKQREAESYLPFWVSSSQADILAAQLQGRPDKSIDPNLFLINIDAVNSDIKCITIQANVTH